MATALRVEWRKTLTTRTWWVLLLVMVPYLAAFAAFIAFAFSQAPPGEAGPGVPSLDDPAVVIAVYGLAMPLGYVFPALVGILAVTTEYRHRTITPTLLAETRRPLIVLAKFAVALVLGLVFGVVGVLSSTLAGAASLAGTGSATLLDDPDVQAALGRTVLGLAVWALIGVAFGLVLRNQIAAIVSLLAFSQIIEPVARFGLGAFEATQGVARVLPGAAGDALTGSSIFTAQGAGTDLLTPLQGGLVLLAYAVVLGVVGTVGFVRRDVA